MIDDEAKREPEKYNKWFFDFQNFIKEGIAVDHENKDALLRLLRFNTRLNGSTSYSSLDEYIKGMKEGQQKIYFVVNQQYDLALKSPYMEPFKNSDVDVLILTNNVDEILF